MFAVDHVLVSDALLDAPFACNLGACLGGCCIVGDSGAPLDGANTSCGDYGYIYFKDPKTGEPTSSFTFKQVEAQYEVYYNRGVSTDFYPLNDEGSLGLVDFRE